MAEKMVCGVDEAGRGPVIGPIVVCGVKVAESKIKKLQNIGVKDSKMLTPARRLQLRDQIIDIVDGYHLMIAEPEQIDAELLDPNSNLNLFEAKKIAEAIVVLKPDLAYIDCPSNNIPAFTQTLESMAGPDCNIICAHKADALYPPVAAASILAKVKRDELVEEIKRKVGHDFGSGYPSDPKTKAFIKDNFDKYDGIFRKTWSTYKKAADRKQTSLDLF